MLVEELIGTPVASCPATTDVATAARRMLADDVGSLAVLRDGELVGIVTERDLLGVVADPAGKATVADVMTPYPDFLARDVEVDDAADWMMAAGYRHLPVLDGGRLVGMVSIKDVLWALTQRRIRAEEAP